MDIYVCAICDNWFIQKLDSSFVEIEKTRLSNEDGYEWFICDDCDSQPDIKENRDE